VLRLKDLLYNQGFTIAGAKKKLREAPAAVQEDQLALPLMPSRERLLLDEVRRDLRQLRNSLSSSAASE